MLSALRNVERNATLVRFIRSHPYLYSGISKLRLSYSRHIAAAAERKVYQTHRNLFSMNEFEKKHCNELRRHGFTVLSNFFDTEWIDDIQAKADALFKSLHLDFFDAYSVQNKKRLSLEGVPYHELEATEKMITLRDPLLNIPEAVQIAFNETLLKIVVNFLTYVPPWYKVMILRDFPSDRPKEAGNFHRDNDEADSIQVFTYLVDIDDSRGPLVYVPATNRYDPQSCRPRLSRDLDSDAYDGRISDEEIEKYYPRSSWQAVRVKRGSVAIIHGNGFHKGPSWPRYGDPGNRPRTAVRLDFHGHKLGRNMRWKGNKIRKQDYTQLNQLQRLFTHESGIIATPQ